MARKQDVLDALMEDHREVERLFAAFDGSTDGAQRRELVDHMIIELVRHSEAEEQHLYPAIRRVLPDGEKIADSELDDHAAAERTMDALDGAEPGSEAFARDVAQLMTQIKEHVAEEESEVFPQLRQALTKEEREELGEKVARAKRLAPT
ncbi:hemerythrin domain-containing protein, partial [Streptomyces sp. A7024]